jgi:hypothetical protein
MSYVVFDTTDKGLLISLSDEGRDELGALLVEREHAHSRGARYVRGTTDIFFDLIEHQLGNGWDALCAEDIGALTDNPYLLADTAERDDHGTLVSVGTVYAYDAYAIDDPVMVLAETGSVFFTAYHTDQDAAHGA